MEKDPTKDRDEFERRVKSIFCAYNQYSTHELLNALYMHDMDFIAKIRAQQRNLDKMCKQSMDDWDNARDKSEVVGLVAFKEQDMEVTEEEILKEKLSYVAEGT